MDDYLMRDQSPLTAEEWARLDELVVQVARKMLVGRRFLPLSGPLGAGVQTVALDTYAWSKGCIHYAGTDPCTHEACAADCEPISLAERRHLPLPLLHKDFRLSWRDIATARQSGIPLDLFPAGGAAAAVAVAEDELIFHGSEIHGLPGLLTAAGQKVRLNDWGKPEAAFKNVALAREALLKGGFYGPYALVLSTDLYATVQRIMPNTGRLEVQFLADLVTAGVFQSPVLAPRTGLLLSVGPENVDLVVAQDLITAYLGPDHMDHLFRVLESLVLRIKQPGAICLLQVQEG
ncbi:MAG: family 1 encapsulin nanocompartment shell protein [Chloroflexia bacterium]